MTILIREHDTVAWTIILSLQMKKTLTKATVFLPVGLVVTGLLVVLSVIVETGPNEITNICAY